MLMSFEISDVVAIASAITAVAAVVVALWNGYAMRKHYRLSVQPRLKLTHRFRGAREFYGIRLVNAGLGPAIIDDIIITLDGEPIDNTHHAWKSTLKTVGLDPSRWHLTRSGVGTIMRADAVVWLFRTDELKEDPNSTIRRLSRVGVKVQYSSLYGQKQTPLEDKLARESFIIEGETQHALYLPGSGRDHAR